MRNYLCRLQMEIKTRCQRKVMSAPNYGFLFLTQTKLKPCQGKTILCCCHIQSLTNWSRIVSMSVDIYSFKLLIASVLAGMEIGSPNSRFQIRNYLLLNLNFTYYYTRTTRTRAHYMNLDNLVSAQHPKKAQFKLTIRVVSALYQENKETLLSNKLAT